MMIQYLEFCSDRLLVALGCEKLYNTANPFDWMEAMTNQGVSKHDEEGVIGKRASEYSTSCPGTHINDSEGEPPVSVNEDVF
jgi:ribonucleotide reductase beta subunit family protein with ferritin-like domain